ncbi:MAG: hypothetical protein WD053_02970 [Gracilimonas sp.]
MKTLKHTLLIGLVALLLTPLSFAQDFDKNRMNRDIKIMENILDELFKIETKSTSTSSNTRGAVRVREVTGSGFISANLFGARSNQVEGNYIPEYGIIFKIPYLLSRNITSVSVIKDSDQPSISFYYDSDDNSGDNQVTEEAVMTRITNFFKDYAPTIGQLGDDEQVTIVYGKRKENEPQLRIFKRSGDSPENEEVKQVPVIKVSAKANDLASLKSGRLSSDDFENRLSISKEGIEEKEQLDLKVMSNILETVLSGSQNEMFEISGKPEYLVLDNFGVLFSMNVRHTRTSARGSIVFHEEEVRNEIRASGVKELDVLSPEEAEEKRAEQAEQAKASFEQLKTDVTDYLIDYGRTLSSVSSDQHILLTINILSNRWGDEIPSRLDLQLKKSVLERLERGDINKDEAINAVTITEY